LPYEELFQGKIPKLTSQMDNISSEEVEKIVQYLFDHGIVQLNEGLWVSCCRLPNGKLAMNLPPGTTAAQKLHEAIHIQHRLEARKAGRTLKSIAIAPLHQRALDEAFANRAGLSLLQKEGATVSELIEAQDQLDYWLGKSNDFGIIDPWSIKVNPYLWQPT